MTILPLNVFATGNQALLVDRGYDEGVNTTVALQMNKLVIVAMPKLFNETDNAAVVNFYK